MTHSRRFLRPALAAMLAVAALALVPALPAPATEPASAPASGPASLAPPPASPVMASVAVHGATTAAAMEAVAASGLEVISVWDRVAVVWAVGPADAVDRARAHPGVRRIEHNGPVELALDTAHLATRADDARQPASGLLALDGSPFDGSGVSIAVIDTGVDGTHAFFRRPDGSSKVVVNKRFFCVAPGQLPVSSSLTDAQAEVCTPGFDVDHSDSGGHGTHVAGIAAGVDTVTGSGTAVRGAAPGADLVALGLDLYYGLFGANEALNWVLTHHDDPCGDGSCPPIRVLNNSWSFAVGDEEHDQPTATDLLVDALVADGVTVVFAAGNSGGDGTEQRTSRESDNPTPGVISAANYDDEGLGLRTATVSGSSSRGRIGRPGSHPDLAAPGTRILSACAAVVCGPPDAYVALSGTSMAAPYLAGVAALLLEARPDLSPADVEQVLERSARTIGAGPYEPDPSNPGHDVAFDTGHGLVDVAAALADVLGRPVPPESIDSSCTPGLFTDPAGDSARDPLPGAGDLTGGGFADDGTVIGVRVDYRRAAEPAPVADREVMRVTALVTAAGRLRQLHLWAELDRQTGTATFAFQDRTDGFAAPVAELTGTWDDPAGTVTVLLPRHVVHEGATLLELVDGDTVASAGIQYEQDVTPLGFVADTATLRCPLVLGS